MTDTRSSATDFPLADRTVLLADDEARLRQVVTMMVQELGARVVDVASSEQAIDTYRRQPSGFDVVLLDMRMNGMDGKDAFREIRRLDPGARIVITSGVRPDRTFLQELEQAGGGG